jgi:hypothetical protein
MHRREFLATMTAVAATAALAEPLRAQMIDSPAGSLGRLRAITIPAPDLDAIEKAYADAFGYRTIWRGKIDKTTAKSWQAPGVAGARTLVMATSDGEPPYFRFVEQAMPAGFRPLTSYGWTAAEFIVQDTQAMVERLRGSAFTMIGAPRPLDGIGNSRAMQVVGPAGEVLYFTHFNRTPAEQAKHKPSPLFINSCFVAVLAVPDMAGATDYYGKMFGNTVRPHASIENLIISNANGMPSDSRHNLAIVALQNGSIIEVDQFPPMARSRARPKGGLPPGIGLVTFDYAGIERADLAWLGAPAISSMPPTARHAVRTLIGAAGELIEVMNS